MKRADFLLEWTDRLKERINKSEYSVADVRKDFLRLIYDSVYGYYRGIIFYNLAEFTVKQKIQYLNPVFPKYKVHLSRFVETFNEPVLRISHFTSLNRGLLMDSWSVFEMSITSLCEVYANETEKEKLLHYEANEVLEILRSAKLNDAQVRKVRKKLSKRHLTHVSITRKMDFLFAKAPHYYGNVKEDKEFLIFFGKLRNASHSNFVYSGNDYKYCFGQAHFTFTDGKPVVWSDPFSRPPVYFSPELFTHMVGRLLDIWEVLINSLPKKDLIPHNEAPSAG